MPIRKPRSFWTLLDRVVSEGEAGLLNVVFHPEFERNGLFFAFYTLNDASSQGTGLNNRLSWFRVLEGDPNRADIASETVLINQFDRHVWHNAGGMAFGPDGYLYLTVGDEGSGAGAGQQPKDRPQLLFRHASNRRGHAFGKLASQSSSGGCRELSSSSG